MLSAYAPVAPLGWLVFVELPVEEAYASLYDSIKRSGAIIFAGEENEMRGFYWPQPVLPRPLVLSLF